MGNESDDDILNGVNNYNTPMGTCNEITDINDIDNDMIIEGDDDVLIGDNNTTMGNENDDVDEINNGIIDEGDEDMDILNDVNGNVTTKGNDDDVDINMDETESEQDDNYTVDDDIMQQMDTLQ
eukprot:402874_1